MRCFKPCRGLARGLRVVGEIFVFEDRPDREHVGRDHDDGRATRTARLAFDIGTSY